MSLAIVGGLLISFTRAEWVASVIGLAVLYLFLVSGKKGVWRYWIIFVVGVVMVVAGLFFLQEDSSAKMF
jgi:hypothetical protein